MSKKIFSVDAVHLAIDKGNPAQLHVAAMGQVSSSGWKGPVLVPRLYFVAPADGIQDLDFRATPPSGIALTVILPISADIVLDLVDWLKGVRVHSAHNAIEATIADGATLASLATVRA
jgi:hypothetical protein